MQNTLSHSKTTAVVRSRAPLPAHIRAMIMGMVILSPFLNASANDTAQAYFDQLAQLCGREYVGEMTFPEDGQDSFAGKLLRASFDECSQETIKVPFAVGSDTSRTWVFTKTAQGIRLKHDHRHYDGTQDDVSNYGGDADVDMGTATSQSFKADAFTAQLIPPATTNIWTVSLSEDKQTLTYHLERHAKPRFTAVLHQVSQEQ